MEVVVVVEEEGVAVVAGVEAALVATHHNFVVVHKKVAAESVEVVRGDFHKNRFPVEEVEGGEEMMETVREKGVAGGSRHIRLVLLVVEAMEMVEDVASLNPPSCAVLVATKEEDRVVVSVPSYKTDCFLQRGLVLLLRTMQGPQCELWQVEVDLLFSHQYHLHCPLLMSHLLLLIGPLLYVCLGLYSPQQCSAYLGSIPQFSSSSSPQPSPPRWQACWRSWGFPTPLPKTRQCRRLCPPCQGSRRLPTELPPRRATFSRPQVIIKRLIWLPMQ